MINISTVTPVYSGAEYLEKLVGQLDRLRDRLEQAGGLHISEAIFVLDEPVDASAQILQHLAETTSWVKVVSLSRNFGQHSATVAGILHSSGDWVVTLDEDLQHPPKGILDMLALAAGRHLDVVLSRPSTGSHGRGYRDRSSRLSKKIIGKLSRNEFIPHFSSFRLIRGQVARAAASVCSHQTYFDTALVWFTTRISSLPMELSDRRYREKKSSGYSFLRLLGHAKKLIISSDIKFLNITIVISSASFAIAVLLELWVLLAHAFGAQPPGAKGWASLISVTLFYGAVISILLGFVLEISKVNMFQGQGRPTFFIVDRDSDEELKKALDRLPPPGDEPG